MGKSDTEERVPILGDGMMPGMCVSKTDPVRRPAVLSLELNGTTEENPEYGTASSTVNGRDRVRLVPFTAIVLCDPLTAPFCIG